MTDEVNGKAVKKSSLGLQQTVVSQGKRIAILERVVGDLIQASNEATQRAYMNTLCCQFLVESMTPDVNAEFEKFLSDRGVQLGPKPEEGQKEESRIIV